MHSSFSNQTGVTHFNNLLMILFQFFLSGVLVNTIHAGEVFPWSLEPSSPVQPTTGGSSLFIGNRPTLDACIRKKIIWFHTKEAIPKFNIHFRCGIKIILSCQLMSPHHERSISEFHMPFSLNIVILNWLGLVWLEGQYHFHRHRRRICVTPTPHQGKSQPSYFSPSTQGARTSSPPHYCSCSTWHYLLCCLHPYFYRSYWRKSEECHLLPPILSRLMK